MSISRWSDGTTYYTPGTRARVDFSKVTDERVRLYATERVGQVVIGYYEPGMTEVAYRDGLTLRVPDAAVVAVED